MQCPKGVTGCYTGVTWCYRGVTFSFSFLVGVLHAHPEVLHGVTGCYIGVTCLCLDTRLMCSSLYVLYIGLELHHDAPMCCDPPPDHELCLIVFSMPRSTARCAMQP